jgi:hypothetical protein
VLRAFDSSHDFNLKTDFVRSRSVHGKVKKTLKLTAFTIITVSIAVHITRWRTTADVTTRFREAKEGVFKKTVSGMKYKMCVSKLNKLSSNKL